VSIIAFCTATISTYGVTLLSAIAGEFVAAGIPVAKGAAVAHEVLFLASASKGLQSLASLNSWGLTVIRRCAQYVVMRVKENWDEYVSLLKQLEDKEGFRPYGGGGMTSPLHLIANAVYLKKGVTAAEFEECLELPEGFITGFAFPECSNRGWWSKFVGSLL
jgi:hypothetical protein